MASQAENMSSRTAVILVLAINSYNRIHRILRNLTREIRKFSPEIYIGKYQCRTEYRVFSAGVGNLFEPQQCGMCDQQRLRSAD